jgi:hypothetical protein
MQFCDHEGAIPMVSKNWKLFVAHLSGFWLRKILLHHPKKKKKIPPKQKNGGSKWNRPPTDEVLLDTVKEAKVKEDIKIAFLAYLFFINSNDKKHSQL